MQEIELEDWEQFEEKIKELFEPYSNKIVPKPAIGPRPPTPSPLLFRGQSNHKWGLWTTLDRLGYVYPKMQNYYRLIYRLKHQIESFTENRWEIITPDDYEKWLNTDGPSKFSDFPGYEYMVFLRHHGFPSPLLDWTRSPYVAAYFAFRHALNSDRKISIYAFSEYPEVLKVWSHFGPYIRTLGPYVRAHKRHFLQQSVYTVCLFKEKIWSYADHGRPIADGKERQDRILKFNIPASEANKVLQILDQYNLNAFSLFGSDESLVETLSLREIQFRGDVF